MRGQLCWTLVVALTLFCLPPQANTSQSDTSQKDRAKKCEQTAKNRGLKGDERATFISSCMAAKDTTDATMSPQQQQNVDKAKSCEQQADQQGLKGKDRRTFVKNCSGK